METFLFATGGYFIGSVPVAYLITRKRHGADLRIEGSRNIGARNAFEVTGNKRIGFAVLALDMLKGIIPLVILSSLGYCDAIPVVSVTIVLGHCYSVWLKFHGGRGLATGGAIMLLISPDILLCWIIMYLFGGFIKKQVHAQAFFATMVTILFELIAFRSLWFFNFRFVCIGDKLALHYSTLAILSLILSRHFQPMYAILRRSKT
jgi:glycerol-3-phosphate acyltransferase PlsY